MDINDLTELVDPVGFSTLEFVLLNQFLGFADTFLALFGVNRVELAFKEPHLRLQIEDLLIVGCSTLCNYVNDVLNELGLVEELKALSHVFFIKLVPFLLCEVQILFYGAEERECLE